MTRKSLGGIVWRAGGTASLLAALLAGCSKKPPPPGRYENTSFLFRITVPTTWAKQENLGKEVPVRFISPRDGDNDPFRETIEVRVEKLPGGFDTKMHAKAWLDNMQAMYREMMVLQQETVTVGGGDKMERVLFVLPKPSAQTAKVIAYLGVKGTRGFVILCTTLPAAYDAYAKTFDQICRTFQAY